MFNILWDCKMNTRLYSIIWGTIALLLGSYLIEINWSILGWICLIFAGMCFYTLLRTFFPGL